MLTEDQLKELETQHKRIKHVVGKGGAWEVVYGKPARATYKRFKAMCMNDAQKADAQDWMARQCVVFPSKEAFDALLEDFPAIPEASADAIGDLVGLSAEADSKA